jgi:small subunit ribosomal protein S2
MKIEIAELLAAGVHFGHKANRWNPKMFPYIYTEKNGVHILDMIQTIDCLKKTCEYLRQASKQDKTILFVGTKKQAFSIVETQAKRSSTYYISKRWLGGMLTNWRTVKSRIEYLTELEDQEKQGLFDDLPTKESMKKKKELDRLQKYFHGVKEMKKLPDILIVVDQKREIAAIKEARALNICIISILDSNCNPDLIDMPIPGNDDSNQSIKYIIKKLADSILLGKKPKKLVEEPKKLDSSTKKLVEEPKKLDSSTKKLDKKPKK